MKNKYYTPKIEEFYIGFEYEYCIYPETNNNFKKEVASWSSLDILYDDFEHEPRELLDRTYRVKYLDKEDIESFGFKKSNKNSWCGYNDYFLGEINPEYPYFLFATIHVPVRDDMYKILVHRHYDEDESIDENDNYREPTTVYVGMIKNKSELKKLLIQLRIINE